VNVLNLPAQVPQHGLRAFGLHDAKCSTERILKWRTLHLLREPLAFGSYVCMDASNGTADQGKGDLYPKLGKPGRQEE
jgi:hypothetical protein